MSRVPLSRFGLPRFGLRGLALALSAAALPSAALAQETDVAGPFASASVIDEAMLGTIAGREDIRQSALANQTAAVKDNSVGDNVRTGDARIDGQAFQNVSGLSILNVNTGNNVAINAAMNVTIAISPAP